MTEQLIYIGTVYSAGLLSFFSPCIFPVLPVYLSILSRGGKKSVIRTVVFVVGLSITFLVLGFGAGIVGEIFYSKVTRIIGGIVVIILGLFQMGLFHLTVLERTKLLRTKSNEDSLFNVFLLGLTFSLGWTPCVGPVLASILLLASTTGNVSSSLFTMFIYMFGLATPFVVFSLASKVLLEKIGPIKKHLEVIKFIGGILVICVGILLIFDQLNIFLQL